MCSLEQLHGVLVDAEYKHFRVYMAKTRGSSTMYGYCTLGFVLCFVYDSVVVAFDSQYERLLI
jgi:hypothetical protein